MHQIEYIRYFLELICCSRNCENHFLVFSSKRNAQPCAHAWYNRFRTALGRSYSVRTLPGRQNFLNGIQDYLLHYTTIPSAACMNSKIIKHEIPQKKLNYRNGRQASNLGEIKICTGPILLIELHVERTNFLNYLLITTNKYGMSILILFSRTDLLRRDLQTFTQVRSSQYDTAIHDL